MALSWNVNKIKNFESLIYYKKDGGDDFYVRPLAEALIWATMLIGMNRITEGNYEEFFERVATYEHLNGPWLRQTDRRFKNGLKDRHITLADIEKHIGLETNASTVSRRQWNTRVAKNALERSLKAAEERLDCCNRRAS
jgi:hypothetical protein